MSFDWANFMAQAQDLSLRTSDEAALRSAISRAYYSVFNRARLRLQQNGVPIPPNKLIGSHQRQWKVYREHADVRCQRLGIEGDRLRANRKRADYADSISNIQSEAKSSLMVALGIVGTLGALPTTLP